MHVPAQCCMLNNNLHLFALMMARRACRAPPRAELAAAGGKHRAWAPRACCRYCRCRCCCETMADPLRESKQKSAACSPSCREIGEREKKQIQQTEVQWAAAQQQQHGQHLATIKARVQAARSRLAAMFQATIKRGAHVLGKPRWAVEAASRVGVCSPCWQPVLCSACRVMRAMRSCTHRPLHSVCVGAGVAKHDHQRSVA